MTYPQDITPDVALRYIEAHGVEVRTVGVSCLTVFAHYNRDGVKIGVSIKPCRSSRYDRKDFCGFAAHPQPSTNHLVYGRTEGEGR